MISKIFHIADVHIRNFKRHSEYKTIFKQLFKYIKENSGQHVHLVARSAWGKREYLYKKLPEEIFSIFNCLKFSWIVIPFYSIMVTAFFHFLVSYLILHTPELGLELE
jgi:hypothetical protein